MPVPTLTAILKRILKQPTAPFHEYHVRKEIEALLDAGVVADGGRSV